MKYTILASDKDLYRQIYAKREDLLQLQPSEWESLERDDPAQMDYVLNEIEQWQTQRDV